MTDTENALTTEHRELGSLEGELVSVHGGDALYVTIKERLWGKRIKCMLPSESHWLEEANAMLSKRVRVSGEVCYSADGVPRMILHVGHIEEVKPPTRPMKELFGALADPEVQRIGAAAFLRKIRGYDPE